MEKEVTSLDFSSMIGDVLYRILAFVNIIFIANYTVREKGFIFIVLTFIAMIVLKTIIGLFNYSIWSDFSQFFLDLGMNSLIGISMGLMFNGYLTGFYEMSWLPMIFMMGMSVLLFILRKSVKNRRTYIGLLK